MHTALPDPPDLDPATLAGNGFTRVRKGFEPIEVNKELGRAADALRTWQLRDRSLVERIEALEHELVDAKKLDESRIASVLGEETARVISAAREAAGEIRTKAEEQAARLLRETEESATTSANALRTEAQALRDEAEQMREKATKEYASKLDEAQRIHDELIATATVKNEELISSGQSTHDDLVSKGKSTHDELVSTAQNRHDELVSTAQSRHDDLVSTGQSTHDELVSTGQATHDDLVREASTVLTERTSEAQAVANGIVDDAKAQGREMVAEAKGVRDRILGDLAERRRIARQQIEGAVAGRDRIVQAMRQAGLEVATVIDEMSSVEDLARDAANNAAETLDDDSDGFLAGLELIDDGVEVLDLSGSVAVSESPSTETSAEVAESDSTESEPLQAEPVPDAVEPVESSETEAETDVPGYFEPATEAEEVTATELEATEAEVVDLPTARAVAIDDLDDDDELDDEDDDELVDEADLREVLDDPNSVVGDAQQSGATVHDLFARIRAQGLEPDEELAAESDEAVLLESADDGQNNASVEEVIDVTASATSADAAPVDPAETDPELGELARVSGILDARDELLVPVERQMLRSLRRIASDEQNEVLDRLRRHKRGRPEIDEVIPSSEEMTSGFSAGLLGDFSSAAEAGYTFWGTVGGVSSTPLFELSDESKGRLESILSGFISVHRAHLERAMEQAAEAGEDTDGLAQSIKAVYRDWRQTSLAEIASDIAIAGFSHGERTAAGSGTPWIWVVDNGGLPCADGEDNALAGPVLSDEAFPTGDLAPPAHAGCRCILVPAHN